MKTNYKNMILAASILLVPLKSGNTTEQITRVAKNTAKSELINSVDSINQQTFDFLNRPLQKFKNNEHKRNLNFIKMPKPHKNLDIHKTKFTGHPDFLNMFLKGVLKGKGDKFIEAQEKYGINASFLVSIASLESGNGMSNYARTRNNIAGMRGKDGYMYFSSVDECIDKMGENLREKYVDKGLTTIQQINKKYAESPEWAEFVVQRMNPIYNASKIKIYDFGKDINKK